MEEFKQDRANSPWGEENRVCESDIFISYAHADDADGFVTGLVQWLKEELSTFASFDVCFVDRKNIQFMDDWEAKISEGLRSSRLLVALVSPNYFLSPFCHKEWQEYRELGSEEALLAYTNTAAVLQIDACEPLENRERLNRQQLLERFISLGRERGTPEHRLPSVDASTAKAFEDWVHSIGRIQIQSLAEWRAKGPEVLKEAKVRERLQELSRTLKRAAGRREARRKSFTNVPPHNPKFTGRVRELRELRDTLAVRKREGAIGVLNSAMPGIGKSALAFEYAHVFAPEYIGGRFHIRAEGLTELSTALEQLETPLGLQLEPAQRADSHKLINAIGRTLHEREGNVLLLFDNLDDPAVLDGATNLIGADQVHILVTTRLPEERFSDRCNCMPVGSIAAEDGIRLIAAHRTPADQGEWDAAREIARRLDGYPFALELVAVTLQHPRRRQRFDDYLEEMTAGGLDLTLRESGNTLESNNITLGQRPREEPRILQALLEPVLGSLTPVQYETLALAAHLPPDNVPLPWLQALIAEDHPETALLKSYQEGAWERSILDVLASLRLLVPDSADGGAEPRFARLHRVLAALVTAREETQAIPRRRARILAYARGRCRELDTEDVPGRWEISAIFETAQMLASDADGDPAEAIATIFLNVGDAFFKLQDFNGSLRATNQAEGFFRRLVEIEGRKELRADLAGSLNNLGLTLRALQRFREALDRFVESERFFRRLVKEEGEKYHCDLAKSLINKAMALTTLRRRPEALQVLEEAEKLFSSLVKLGGNQYLLQLAQCHGNKGIVLCDEKQFHVALNEFEAAERFFLTLVDEEGRPELRADYAICLTNRGKTLYDLMKFSESLKAHEEAAKVFRLLAEEEQRHEHRARLGESLENKGRVLNDLERFSEALQAFDESESILRTLVEEEGRTELRVEYATCLTNKGKVLNELLKFSEALKAHEEAAKFFRLLARDQQQDEYRARLAESLENKASVLANLHRFSDALRSLTDSESILRRLVEEQGRVEFRADLARSLGKQGNMLLAQQNVHGGLGILEKAQNIFHTLVEEEGQVDLRDHLAEILCNKGRALLALQHLREALRPLEEAEHYFRTLVEKEDREEVRSGLAKTLGVKGIVLSDLRVFPEALETTKDAQKCFRRLTEGEVQTDYRDELATSISVEGMILNSLGRFPEALRALEEAERIFRLLVESEGRTELNQRLAKSLSAKGIVLQNTRRFPEALVALIEAENVFRLLVEEEGRTELRGDFNECIRIHRNVRCAMG